MTKILYQNGDYFVSPAKFGRSDGFGVYRNEGTAAVRVATIGYSGEKGLARAIVECDKRANEKHGKYKNPGKTKPNEWIPAHAVRIRRVGKQTLVDILK